MEIIIWIPAVSSESGFSSTFVGNPDLHPGSKTFHHAKRNIHLDLIKSTKRQNLKFDMSNFQFAI